MAGMNIAPLNKRTIRQVTNPLDRATIVSILPLEINEYKHTIQPGHFHIPAASPETPEFLVVGPSSWWRDIGEEMPLIEIPNGSMLIAESVVKDYCNGMICIDDYAYPGLFYVPGEHTIKSLKDHFSKELNKAIEKQKNWFKNLIDMADKDWAASNGNPTVISGLMKMAAEALSLQDRSWMKTTLDVKKVPCIGCGNLRNPAYPICGYCNRIVDLQLAKNLGIVETSTPAAVIPTPKV